MTEKYQITFIYRVKMTFMHIKTNQKSPLTPFMKKEFPPRLLGGCSGQPGNGKLLKKLETSL